MKSAEAAIASMKSAKAAVAAAKNVIAFPLTRERREKDELAFLPAALEIVETPPSPFGRAIGATIIALFVLALIWRFSAMSILSLPHPGRWSRAAASSSYSPLRPAWCAPYMFAIARVSRQATC